MFKKGLFSSIIALMAFTLSAPASGAPTSQWAPNVKDLNILTETLARHRSVFLSHCRTNGTINVLWFTVGDNRAEYIEYFEGSGDMNNAGEFELKPHAIDSMDLMGGIGTHAIEHEIIRHLLRGPFELVPPSRFRATVLQTPHRKCGVLWTY